MPLGLYTASLNFETKKEIGQEGRNSKVFIAHDKQLDGDIVVKQILKSKIPNATEYYNESKILYNAKHQNVVQVNYGCEDNDNVFIAMPYYKNGSLKGVIDNRYLMVREIIRYSLQFLSGLNHIHTKKLIHFDVKPDNILLSDSDEALLSDFGLSKAMDNLGFSTGSMVYEKQVPPEVFQQIGFTIQYDIYLAGLTLYRLCNGNQKFYDQFTSYTTQQSYIDAIKSGNFPNRKDYLPHIPKKMIDAINKALNVNPKDRYNNVLELMNELSAININLDWQFKPIQNSNIWELDADDRVFTVNVSENQHNNNKFNIFAFRTMKGSGRQTTEMEYCHDNIQPQKIQKLLDKIFKNLG